MTRGEHAADAADDYRRVVAEIGQVLGWSTQPPAELQAIGGE
jgi:hypothetical protein